MGRWTTGLINFYCLICGITGQIILYGCPEGWMHNGNQCYKFESNSPKVYEEAAVDCWMDGATLVSINSIQEHTYISNYLEKLHLPGASTWLTSGLYGNSIITWEGDGTVNGDVTHWIHQPQAAEVFSHIAYQIGDRLFGGYGWNLVSASIPFNYICEIPQSKASQIDAYNRDVGYGKDIIDKNHIISGPHLIAEPVGVVIVGASGNTIYLECDARANPLPTYKWFRGVSGNETITASTDSRYTLSGGRLTIQNPKVADGNFYRCSVENDQGVILSRMAQIMFGYLHQFSPVRPDDAWGTQSEGVKIACQAPGYSPAVKYSWYKFRSNNWVYPGHPYHFNSQAGYLYFSEVQFTDDRQYFCIVTLTARQGMVPDSEQPLARTSFGRYLVIKPGKNAGGYGPIIHTHTFPSPALRGNTIRMECIAYGSLPLSYSWYREDGRPLPKGSQIIDRNRVLTIPNAQLDAEGNYVCKCTRPGAVATKVIALQIEAVPYFPINIKEMLTDPGQMVIWRCRAVARPAATYMWYKNGQLINYIPGKIEQQGSNLVIHNIDENIDVGMYQCAASNQHGTTFSTGQLKVLSFKPNFHRFPLPPQTLGPVGGNITIQCKVEGAPLPTVIWEKNGGQLNVQPGFLQDRLGMDTKNSLIIKGLQYSDSGTYTCKATNINGEATNSTLLRIISGVVITQAPIPTTVRVNRTAFLYCEASYNMADQDLVYTWTFNGHRLDSKNSNYRFVQENSIGVHGLYIREAQFKDQGRYQCEARTPLHTDIKSAFLSVEGPPGMPAGVYVDHSSITTFSARVIWTNGLDISKGVPLIGYDIEVETQYHPGVWKVVAADVQEVLTIDNAKDFGLREDQRTYVVASLVPDNGYRFRVRAINELGRGPLASTPSIVTKIPAAAPVKTPSDLSGGGGKVGTLSITWTPLDPTDHCAGGIGYRVYWKLRGNDQNQWLKGIVKGNKGKYVATVGKENFYLEYDVKIGVYNDMGDGPNSTTVVIHSAEGLPVAVPTITAVNSYNESSIEVVWDPVPNDRLHMKGRIRGYTIQYYWDTVGIRPMKGYQPVKFRWRNTHGEATSAILIDLEINSVFYFRMQVFNSAGRGPKGEWRYGESPANAPLDYPMFVKVYSHTEHSVRVTWRGIGVTLNEESLTGYVLKWWKISEDIRSASRKTVGRVMETIVHGLQSRTVYVLRVAGLSGGGDGQMSNPKYFTILGGVIEIDPSTSQICYGDQACSSSLSDHDVYTCIWTLFICVISYFLS